jgi:hypothetical protein
MTTTSLRRPLEKLGKGPRPAGPRGARGPRRGLPALPDRGWRPSGQATRTSSHGPRTGATTRCSVLRGPRASETAKCLILNESLFPVINITGNSGSLGADSGFRANARSTGAAHPRPPAWRRSFSPISHKISGLKHFCSTSTQVTVEL